MITHQQDLVFFDDNSLISNKLLKGQSLNIITHESGTSSTWLVNTLIENCLMGTANSVNRDLVATQSAQTSVTYISFLHSSDFVINGCRKQGLDLDHGKAFHYIDCFSCLFSKQIKESNDAGSQIQDIFAKIEKQIHSQSFDSKYVVFFAPEILLAATNISSDNLLHHIQCLNRVCNVMTVVAHTDEAFLNSKSVTSADPAFKITEFYVKLHHKSSLNVNIRPLVTGKAKDITGSINVSRGALPPPNTCRVLEKEYAFHISKEASVKIFFK